MTTPDAQIRAYPNPRCFVCGTEGAVLYRGLEDRLFDAPGKWNIRRCPDSSCGVLWLDPMPYPEDIGRAYQTYYTHTEAQRQRNPYVQRLFNLVKSGYVTRYYGYPPGKRKVVESLLGTLVRFHPTRKASLDGDVIYLPYKPGGRLLEIGCGSGKLLEFLKSLNWVVQGVDLDPIAVMNARKKGLAVALGTLQEQHYSDSSFDAVVMSHVIEHVHDPEGLLRECYRILKNQGKIVILTPNANSIGHRLFKSNWRGLESPRHLQVFTSHALRRLAQRAGFSHPKILTTSRGAQEIYLTSRAIQKRAAVPRRNVFERVRALLFHLAELGAGILQKDAGEEIVLIAQK